MKPRSLLRYKNPITNSSCTITSDVISCELISKNEVLYPAFLGGEQLAQPLSRVKHFVNGLHLEKEFFNRNFSSCRRPSEFILGFRLLRRWFIHGGFQWAGVLGGLRLALWAFLLRGPHFAFSTISISLHICNSCRERILWGRVQSLRRWFTRRYLKTVSGNLIRRLPYEGQVTLLRWRRVWSSEPGPNSSYISGNILHPTNGFVIN